MDRVPLDGRVGDPDDGGQEQEQGERNHGVVRVALELTADVAAGIGAVAEGQDVDCAECGHEGDERDHASMIGRERERT
jgi:hypothetical protein